MERFGDKINNFTEFPSIERRKSANVNRTKSRRERDNIRNSMHLISDDKISEILDSVDKRSDNSMNSDRRNSSIFGMKESRNNEYIDYLEKNLTDSEHKNKELEDYSKRIKKELVLSESKSMKLSNDYQYLSDSYERQNMNSFSKNKEDSSNYKNFNGDQIFSTKESKELFFSNLEEYLRKEHFSIKSSIEKNDEKIYDLECFLRENYSDLTEKISNLNFSFSRISDISSNNNAIFNNSLVKFAEIYNLFSEIDNLIKQSSEKNDLLLINLFNYVERINESIEENHSIPKDNNLDFYYNSLIKEIKEMIFHVNKKIEEKKFDNNIVNNEDSYKNVISSSEKNISSNEKKNNVFFYLFLISSSFSFTYFIVSFLLIWKFFNFNKKLYRDSNIKNNV